MQPRSPCAEECTSQGSHTGSEISGFGDDSPKKLVSPRTAPDFGVQEEEGTKPSAMTYPIDVLREKPRLHDKQNTGQQNIFKI